MAAPCYAGPPTVSTQEPETSEFDQDYQKALKKAGEAFVSGLDVNLNLGKELKLRENHRREAREKNSTREELSEEKKQDQANDKKVQEFEALLSEAQNLQTGLKQQVRDLNGLPRQERVQKLRQDVPVLCGKWVAMARRLGNPAANATARQQCISTVSDQMKAGGMEGISSGQRSGESLKEDEERTEARNKKDQPKATERSIATVTKEWAPRQAGGVGAGGADDTGAVPLSGSALGNSANFPKSRADFTAEYGTTLTIKEVKGAALEKAPSFMDRKGRELKEASETLQGAAVEHVDSAHTCKPIGCSILHRAAAVPLSYGAAVADLLRREPVTVDYAKKGAAAGVLAAPLIAPALGVSVVATGGTVLGAVARTGLAATNAYTGVGSGAAALGGNTAAIGETALNFVPGKTQAKAIGWAATEAKAAGTALGLLERNAGTAAAAAKSGVAKLAGAAVVGVAPGAATYAAAHPQVVADVKHVGKLMAEAGVEAETKIFYRGLSPAQAKEAWVEGGILPRYLKSASPEMLAKSAATTEELGAKVAGHIGGETSAFTSVTTELATAQKYAAGKGGPVVRIAQATGYRTGSFIGASGGKEAERIIPGAIGNAKMDIQHPITKAFFPANSKEGQLILRSYAEKATP